MILTEREYEQVRSNDPNLQLLTIRYYHVEEIKELVSFLNSSKNSHISRIAFSESALNDELLTALSLLDIKLTSLYISCPDSEITDQGVFCITSVKSLEHLEISGKLSDAALGHLLALKNLKNLEISGGSLTEKGIQDFLKSHENGENIEVYFNYHDEPVVLNDTKPYSSPHTLFNTFSTITFRDQYHDNAAMLKQILDTLNSTSVNKIAEGIDSNLLRQFRDSLNFLSCGTGPHSPK